MKKAQLVFALVLVTIISSCSKDDATPIPTPAPPTPAATNFAEIRLSHIQAKNSLMTAANIQATDGTGVLWPAGTVMIFKTTAGTYGKFEVVSINLALNDALTINVVLFNADGTVKSTTNNIVVRGTFGCDLDIPAEDGAGLQSDFKWDRLSATDTSLKPINGAIFLKYTF
ncbi:MAG: hypothetical protein JHC39_01740 [Lentimicrobium sp.]|nr:hypothetical protein [Lentimicrobium sp.]